MSRGKSLRRRSTALLLSMPFFLFGVSVQGYAQNRGSAETGGAEGPGVTLCLAVTALADMRAIVVVPSGTVFAAQAPVRSKKPHGAVVAVTQALVTTETVTLMAIQPCSGADAAGVVSATRGWHGPVALSGGRGQVFHPAGRISGNGLDTGWLDADAPLRALVRAGGLSATVHGRLPQDVRLLESAADQDAADKEAQARLSVQPGESGPSSDTGQAGDAGNPVAGLLPDMSEGAIAADDLPSQRHGH
ncbi:MAG: hypothetical protein ABF593_10035 [Acetobacter papayae]|uniref:hypothetical protein n=1 Tax=Acetobacter papayae TaxID=1076592 RepID=UPI0039EA32F0